MKQFIFVIAAAFLVVAVNAQQSQGIDCNQVPEKCAFECCPNIKFNTTLCEDEKKKGENDTLACLFMKNDVIYSNHTINEEKLAESFPESTIEDIKKCTGEKMLDCIVNHALQGCEWQTDSECSSVKGFYETCLNGTSTTPETTTPEAS